VNVRIGRLIARASILLLLLSCVERGNPKVPEIIVEVSAGAHTRTDSLVSILLPQDLKSVQVVELIETGFLPVFSQRDSENPERLYWIVSGTTPKGTIRTYHVLLNAEPNTDSILEVENKEGSYLEIRHSGLKVLQYRYGIVEPPTADIPNIYARSGYIHPIWTPEGLIVSDDFSPLYPHHRGLWFAWTKSRYKDRTPDFWNLHKGTGAVRHDELEDIWEGPVFAGFRAAHGYIDFSASSQEEVLNELWEVKVHAAAGPEEGFFIFDVLSLQNCASDALLELPEYHYGGMAFRGARNWTPEAMEVLTSEGLDREGGDGSRADWCLISGELDGGKGGLLLMSHPGNFRAPQPLRVHPGMPYFTFAPQSLGDMEIEPGRPYLSRYRVVVFNDEWTLDRIQALWDDYANPPRIKIVKGGNLSTGGQ